VIKAFTNGLRQHLAAVPHRQTGFNPVCQLGAMVGLSPGQRRPTCSATPSAWRLVVELSHARNSRTFLGAFPFRCMGYLHSGASNVPNFAPSIRYFASFTLFGSRRLIWFLP